jgi:hypothetical protein
MSEHRLVASDAVRREMKGILLGRSVGPGAVRRNPVADDSLSAVSQAIHSRTPASHALKPNRLQRTRWQHFLEMAE